ncbi:MAG: hypothetical protein AAGA48_23765 [Myxococcota bacterium]
MVLLAMVACSEFGIGSAPDPVDLPPPTGDTAPIEPKPEPDLPPGAAEDPVYACTATDLFAIDPDTGAYDTSGDLVGLPDGFLYWTVRGEPNDQLVKVDPLTGATFLVGPIDEAKLFGLGYAEGALFGFGEEGPIVRIDPKTAETTELRRDGTAWWGATTNPVKW